MPKRGTLSELAKQQNVHRSTITRRVQNGKITTNDLDAVSNERALREKNEDVRRVIQQEQDANP